LIASVAARANEAPQREQIRIVAESLPNPTAGDVGSVAARSVLRTFLTNNPDIRVEPFAMPAIEGSRWTAGPSWRSLREWRRTSFA
jgi:hypothetical protein